MKKSHINLKVKESLPKDVGRAIVRIDPAEMDVLGLEVGEIIAIAVSYTHLTLPTKRIV